MKLLDKAANLAIILAVLIFVGLVFRGQIGLPRSHAAPPTIVGSTLKGIPTSTTHETLVLVVSTACHFCRESLPFYGRLYERTQGRVDFVAVVPQSGAEAEQFLDSGGVKATRIINATPELLGVTGTPTLLLVDTNGKVTNAWLGKLDERGEKDVIAHLPV